MTEQELKQFQEDVAAILKRDYFPESEGYSIHTQLVRKNNNVKKYGITIGVPDSRVAPNFYVDDYAVTHTPEAAAEAIFRNYQAHKKDAQDINENKINQLFDYEQAKDLITYRVVNRQRNSDIESSCPTIPIAPDLMMVFYLQLDREASCLIKNDFCTMWGLTENIEKTLFTQADINTERLKPACLKTMAAIMKEMVPESMWDEMELADNLTPPMYVLTTEDRVYGATTILYRNGQLLQECLERIQNDYNNPSITDFYIIPSSTHEVLLVPATDDITKESLQAMCQEVNSTQVDITDQLSDNIFQYNQDDGFQQITFYQQEITR